MPVCGHEWKILAQKKWTGFIQHMEKKKNGLVASSPWRKEKWADCIKPMEKRIMGWLHPAHGEKEKWGGCIQPMELKTIEKKKNGLVSRKEEREGKV